MCIIVMSIVILTYYVFNALCMMVTCVASHHLRSILAKILQETCQSIKVLGTIQVRLHVTTTAIVTATP